MPLYRIEFTGVIFIEAADRDEANIVFDETEIRDENIDGWHIFEEES